MNDLPEEHKSTYTCEDCKCKTCHENFINTVGVTCYNCLDCEDYNRHIEECSAYNKKVLKDNCWDI